MWPLRIGFDSLGCLGKSVDNPKKLYPNRKHTRRGGGAGMLLHDHHYVLLKVIFVK